MDARTLADRYWDDVLELNPLLATQVGDDRFDDRLPDPSPEGIERRREIHSVALETALTVRHDASPSDRAICDTIEAIARPEIDAIDLGMYRFSPIDQVWGPGTLLDQLASIHSVDSDEDVAHYLRRLEAVDPYLRACAGLLVTDGSPAQTAPKLIVERCIRQVEELVATTPDESPALRPLPKDDEQARDKALDTLRWSILPAYAGYLIALRAYRLQARDSIGLFDLIRGDEMYGTCIRRFTSLDLDPLEIHQIGLAELQKVQEERTSLARILGAADPAAAIAARDATGRNAFVSRDEMLRVAEDQVRRGWDRAHEFFGRLPRSNCEVRPVDPSREQDVLEHYVPATADGSRPGIYYVNTANPQDRKRHSLATTTFHEANPGHHLQMALEQERTDRPALLRFGAELAGVAVVEGWGLYAERLADEMGLFEDEYERLGMLELQALRSARLVVDTGIHAFGWPRDRVIDTLVDTGLDRTRSELETDRYVAMPGQALAYKIGHLEIAACRAREEQEAGASFSLAHFHDRILAAGSVPLTTFRREFSGRDPTESAEHSRRR